MRAAELGAVPPKVDSRLIVKGNPALGVGDIDGNGQRFEQIGGGKHGDSLAASTGAATFWFRQMRLPTVRCADGGIAMRGAKERCGENAASSGTELIERGAKRCRRPSHWRFIP